MSTFEIGQVIEGKVTGIQSYGAFVALSEETQGLVHISEITNGYVQDVNDHLNIGDEVKVKVLDVNEENNKVSLSVRATEAKPAAKNEANRGNVPSAEEQAAGFNTLKEKLQDWINQSENK